MLHTLTCLSLSVLTLSLSLPAFGWGERGHDSVTRIAARLLATDADPEVAAWGKVLASKEHMLAHLSNVPDIAWRRGGPEMDRLNTPSHFVDLEFALPKGELNDKVALPQSFEAYQKMLQQNCKKPGPFCAPGETMADKLLKAGHAPFRIQNLTQELSVQLSELKRLQADAQSSPEARTEAMQRALLYAGVLSHFVGDIANPHHTSVDYDGWHTNQGGLHSYFESELVDAQDFALETEVYLDAKRHSPSLGIFLDSKGDFLKMAWALVRDSHQKKSLLAAHDQRFSLLKPSESQRSDEREKSKPRRAERRAPYEVSREFRDLIVMRLSMGADALAQFWKAAFIAAGKPDPSFYRSYYYPLDPAFIPLGYDVGPAKAP